MKPQNSELVVSSGLTADVADLNPQTISFPESSELLEAQALYDFSARSVREVNFSKGDTIILYKQVSNDWWKGSVNGKEGLIPDKYIMLKIRFVNAFYLSCNL